MLGLKSDVKNTMLTFEEQQQNTSTLATFVQAFNKELVK